MQITQERLIEVLKDVTKVVEQDAYDMMEESVSVEGWSNVLACQALFLTPRGKVRIDWQELEDDQYMAQALTPEEPAKRYEPEAGEDCYVKFHYGSSNYEWRDVNIRYVGEDIVVFEYNDCDSGEVVVKWSDSLLEFKSKEKSMYDYLCELHEDFYGFEIDHEMIAFLGYMNDHNMIKDPSDWYCDPF